MDFFTLSPTCQIRTIIRQRGGTDFAECRDYGIEDAARRMVADGDLIELSGRLYFPAV